MAKGVGNPEGREMLLRGMGMVKGVGSPEGSGNGNGERSGKP